MKSFLSILRNADIFYKLTAYQLEKVANLCQEQKFNSGEMIFSEGSKSDELYIIADGVVDILVNPDLVSDNPGENHTPVSIATLRRGQSFGEIALVDQGVRSASAKSLHDNTILLIIPRNTLISLCEEHPDLGYKLMLNLAADLALKIRSTGLRIREELLYRCAQK